MVPGVFDHPFALRIFRINNTPLSALLRSAPHPPVGGRQAVGRPTPKVLGQVEPSALKNTGQASRQAGCKERDPHFYGVPCKNAGQAGRVQRTRVAHKKIRLKRRILIYGTSTLLNRFFRVLVFQQAVQFIFGFCKRNRQRIGPLTQERILGAL